MSTESSNAYDIVLADLMAQREKIDAAIAAVQAARSLSGGGATVNSGMAAKIESDSFFGLTVVEAAVKYLGMMKRPQKVSTITEALKEGGYSFTTDNPLPGVASILNRDDLKGGEIVRIGKGTFGLASWYKTRPKRQKQNGDAVSEAEDSTQGASPSSTESDSEDLE